MLGPPMVPHAAILIYPAVALALIVLYVVFSVAVERTPGCLAIVLIVGLIVAYFAFRS